MYTYIYIHTHITGSVSIHDQSARHLSLCQRADRHGGPGFRHVVTVTVTCRVRAEVVGCIHNTLYIIQVLDMLSLAEFAQTPYSHLSPSQQRVARVAREVVGCAGNLYI